MNWSELLKGFSESLESEGRYNQASILRDVSSHVETLNTRLAESEARVLKLENVLAKSLIHMAENNQFPVADILANSVFETWEEIRKKATPE